jgi:hypothetical protein
MGQRIVENSAPSSDAESLMNWLARVRPDGGGGDEGEAIEVVLARIADLGNFDAVLLAGDEPSHHRQDLRKHGRNTDLTALEIARGYRERNVPIHTFVVGEDPRTIRDFAEIAAASGGQTGRLDGSSSMRDMAVLAMLSGLKGKTAVREYMDRHQLTTNARDFAERLLLTSR